MTWLALAIWTAVVLLAGAVASLAYWRATSRNQVGDGEPDRNEFTHGWSAEP